MITGKVTSDEARIRLKVKGPRRRQRETEAVIDTDYTGSLTLPHRLVVALGLSWQSVDRGTLADGSECLVDVYEARVVWDGKPRRILVDEADTDLVAFLSEHKDHLVIDADVHASDTSRLAGSIRDRYLSTLDYLEGDELCIQTRALGLNHPNIHFVMSAKRDTHIESDLITYQLAGEPFCRNLCCGSDAPHGKMAWNFGGYRALFRGLMDGRHHTDPRVRNQPRLFDEQAVRNFLGRSFAELVISGGRRLLSVHGQREPQ